MKQIIIFCCALLIAVNAAAGQSTIVLNDGSVIVGEIISLKDGIYHIQSQLLGSVKLEQSKVKSVRSESVPAETQKAETDGTKIDPAQVQQIQQTMMSSPEIMELIQSLTNDQSVQFLLNDAEVLNAINVGDLEKLVNNPNFQQLLNNPTVQQINEKVAQ